MKNLKKYIKEEIKSLIENKIVKRYDMPEEIKDALENQLEMYPLIRFVSNLKAVNSIPPSYRVFLLNGNHFDIIYEDYSLMVKINKTESWFNIYKKGDYQEIHQHTNTIISAVYFLKSNQKSSSLIFRPPFIDQLDVKKTNNFCCNGNIEYKPIPGRLIVFRSFVPHCVPQHKDNQDRITLSYNFR
jgi:hypothetical protein